VHGAALVDRFEIEGGEVLSAFREDVDGGNAASGGRFESGLVGKDVRSVGADQTPARESPLI
jgi:hypothetical protein